MRRAATAIGALAMVATLATACGSDSSDDAKSEATATTQAEATTTTTEATAPTAAQLDAALLTVNQMGEGWTAAAADSDSTPGCLTELIDDGTLPGPKAEAQFSYTAENNGVTAYVFEGLIYAGEDSQSAFNQVTKALDTCTRSASQPEGPTAIEPLSFPSYGEDSSAWTATVEGTDGSTEVTLIAALQSDVIVLTMGGQDAGTMAPSAMEPIISAAVDKVETAANS